MYALEEYHSVQSKGENNLRPILYSAGSMHDTEGTGVCANLVTSLTRAMSGTPPVDRFNIPAIAELFTFCQRYKNVCTFLVNIYEFILIYSASQVFNECIYKSSN